MVWSPSSNALRGKVAVVAGATRGAGRGIATALGESGATVICTGRSTRGHRSVPSDYDRPETIEETAELVTTKLGGQGIPFAADHLNRNEVRRLANMILRDYGAIDILVNDIWGGELLKGSPPTWNKPIWECDLEKGLRILRLAVETHLVTSHELLPLLVKKPGGLLVEVTDGAWSYNKDHYRISVFYDLAKVSVNRLAFSQGHELAPFGATAVSVSPGWIRSEMMLDAYGVTEENWREALKRSPPGFATSESPRYVGRAVVAIATDADKKRWNQKSVTAEQMAEIYGFTDLDGSRPRSWKFFEASEAGENPSPNDFR